MTRWGISTETWFRRVVLGACLAGAGIVGCGQKAAVKEDVTVQNQDKKTEDSPKSGDTTPTPAATPPVADGLHQTFVKATRGADDPPAEEGKPPDVTMTSKATHQLLKDLQKTWDTIRFVDAANKPIHYTAVVETTLGKFEIDLSPQAAPNHVRNFIALSRIGYYDSLLVDRIHHEVAQVSTEGPTVKLDMIELGCPVGNGEAPSGSIGYWLKPEFNDQVKHEEGTVGFCRGAEADSASTRIYITLDKAPLLDGNYSVIGKVKSGLDVVRKIASQPVIVEATEQSGSHRPEKEIVIKKVTIVESK